MMNKVKQVKYKKAPQAPRRFKSSYMFFSIEKHKTIRKELEEQDELKNVSVGDSEPFVCQAERTSYSHSVCFDEL